jgi:hypothetical protein
MRNTYHTTDSVTSRPSILEIVSNYTFLRRSGREQLGLCPIHGEKTPSFRVNENKGRFYCFGCGAGGDVIRFVELIEGCSFREALAILGMGNDPPPPPEVRQTAERVTKWIRDQIELMNFRLRELDEQIEMADEIPDPQLAESLWRERRILADLRDDLSGPEYRQDFIQIKDIIEKITEGFE